MQDEFLGMKLEYFYDFLMSTFPREEKLKLELERKFLNLIFDSAVEAVDPHSHEKGLMSYTPTKELFISHLDRGSITIAILRQSWLSKWGDWL